VWFVALDGVEFRLIFRQQGAALLGDRSPSSAKSSALRANQ
jgi:hypothetical protein